MCKPTLSLHAKQVLLSAAWGVLPCGAWLAQHGCEHASRCEVCGGLDEVGHCLIGCPGEHEGLGADPTAERVQGWQKAVGPRMGWVGPVAGDNGDGVAVAPEDPEARVSKKTNLEYSIS